MGTVMAVDRVREGKNYESYVTMGINYCKEDKLDEKRPCKLIYDDGTIVTIEDELKHVETLKK